MADLPVVVLRSAEEGAQLRFELETEIKRLEAAWIRDGEYPEVFDARGTAWVESGEDGVKW